MDADVGCEQCTSTWNGAFHAPYTHHSTDDGALDLRQSLVGIAESLESYAGLVQERQIQTAHLPVRSSREVKNAAGADLAAAPAQHHHRQLVVLVVPGHHARTVQDHRIVR